MSIHLGNQEVRNVTLGTTQVKRVWRGNNLIWEYGSPPVMPEGGYRYVRMRLLVHGASAIQEVEVFANGENVALGKTVTTSISPWTTGNPQGLVDGNRTFINTISWWIGHNTWVWKIDLGQGYPITHIDVVRPVANNTQITIEVSEDNVNWVPTTGAGTGANPRFTI